MNYFSSLFYTFYIYFQYSLIAMRLKHHNNETNNFDIFPEGHVDTCYEGGHVCGGTNCEVTLHIGHVTA